jgi:predicted metal-binding membrane protein
MNLAWMAGLFVLIYIEKTWRHGLVLARIAGLALIALGVAIAAHPALLELVSS